MSNKWSEISEPIRDLVQDLGINPSEITDYTMGSIFKEGTNTMLFLTKVSHVYTHSHHLEEENKDLRSQVKELEKDLKDATSQVIALQKNEITLKKDNEMLATSNQNSKPGTVLFGIASILFGVSGGYFNASKYPAAIIVGLIGLAFSVFASLLINSGKYKEKDNA